MNENFASHRLQCLFGICVTGALGDIFRMCQSPISLNCFGQVMPTLGKKIAFKAPVG